MHTCNLIDKLIKLGRGLGALLNVNICVDFKQDRTGCGSVGKSVTEGLSTQDQQS